MLERIYYLMFSIANADVFQSIRTPDPLVNEKRVRERRMLTALLGAVAFSVFSMVVAPGAQTDARPLLLAINEVARLVATILSIGALTSVIWFTAECFGFWRFLKGNGLWE